MIIPKRLLYPKKKENSSTVSGQKFEEKSETFTKMMIPAELARKRKVRPFWVVPQNVKDRDTCLCEIHVNFHFMISKLKFYSIIKESCSSEITEARILVHIDFSENYVCKYSCEVQSAHFGGSKPQITLHTAVTSENRTINR
nr:unnamed protein product [Callosobruchus analis]